MIYTRLHGKRNLVDTHLTFLSYILTLTQLIWMEITHSDQILFMSHVRIFMIQAMFKTGKLVPPLTQLYYHSESLVGAVKLKNLRPLQTWLTMKVPNKYQSQARTVKLHVYLCHNHNRGRAKTLQRLASTILLSKLLREANLVILEAANTIYALILILNTQKYTDTDVCKNLFKPLSMCYSHSLFNFLSHTHHSIFFSFGANAYKYFISTKIQHINKQSKIKQLYSEIRTTLHQKFYASIAINQATSKPHFYGTFLRCQNMDAVQDDNVAWVFSLIQKQAHWKKKTPHHSQPFTILYDFSKSVRSFSYP